MQQVRAERERETGVPSDRRTALGRQRPEAGRDMQRGTAMPCGWLDRGEGGGLQAGPDTQCRAAAPADRRAQMHSAGFE
jgi:hypothetical protein